MRTRPIVDLSVVPAVVLLLAGLSSKVAAAETFQLVDEPSDVIWRVEVDVQGAGEFRFQPPKDVSEPRKEAVSLQATYRFAGRRLPASGRNADAFRAVRRYDEASSRITVGGQTSVLSLRPERASIVTRLTDHGAAYHSTSGPLTAGEMELLPFPGELVLLPALLPDAEVGIGATWIPDEWLVPALAATEISLNSKLTCRLESVTDGMAVVRFEGTIEGLARGAKTESKLRGALRVDLKNRAIVAAVVEQVETRSIGPLSPGMDLKLTSRLTRRPLESSEQSSTKLAAISNVEPSGDALRLEYSAPWGGTLVYPREWQLFHQTGQMLILRLLESGKLIAQCNVAPLGIGVGSEPVSLEQFQADIRASLDQQFKEFGAVEKSRVGNMDVYRVNVSGTAAGQPRQWRYYLATSAEGRQAAFVVTAEPENLKQLADRDLDLVRGLSFSTTLPERAAAK